MIVRYLTQNDIVEHDKVSSQAFVYSCDINDRNSVLPCDKMLGAFDDDDKTLFADFELNERKCFFNNKILSCAAVGGVAAKPEHRGKGAVKKLFGYLIDSGEYDISILYPFSEEYYRKLGYESVGKSLKASIPFSEFKNIRRNNDAYLYEGKNPDKLVEIYNNCASKYGLCFVRENSDAFSGEPYLSQKYTYVWKDESFATFSIDREKSVVDVYEIYFDSFESLEGILGFLKSFEGNQSCVCFEKIPCGSPILNLVSDIKHCEISVCNTGAARILNVENVLMAYSYPTEECHFSMEIENVVYTVDSDGSSVNICINSGETPDASMNISVASRVILSGIGGVEEANFIPGLKISNPASDLFKVFSKKTCFFTDEF